MFFQAGGDTLFSAWAVKTILFIDWWETLDGGEYITRLKRVLIDSELCCSDLESCPHFHVALAVHRYDHALRWNWRATRYVVLNKYNGVGSMYDTIIDSNGALRAAAVIGFPTSQGPLKGGRAVQEK